MDVRVGLWRKLSAEELMLLLLLLFFYYYILSFFFLTLQYCISFAKYRNESATGIPAFPILNPPPSSQNWCFWTVVLEKTLESHLDSKEIQPVHSKGDQCWAFVGRNDAKAETLVLWPPRAKSWLIGKDSDAGRDWGQEEKGTTEDEMAGWHHRLNGREF